MRWSLRRISQLELACEELGCALRGIRNLVAECIQDLKDRGEDIPEPISCRKYSGKFMVRVPPDVHRDLALKAAESGVSLNRLASSKLSR
jgi:predicted HicB family RNase H-like nuclease